MFSDPISTGGPHVTWLVHPDYPTVAALVVKDRIICVIKS